MKKKETRQLYKQKRNELSEQERMKLDDLILINFQQLQLPFIDTVLSFYPIQTQNEINTFLLTDYLQFKNPGSQIAYPRIDFNKNTFDAVIPDSNEWKENAYNISEPASGKVIMPSEIDLALVPMLAFDMQGHRVGYGKGFYDRYLSLCDAECIKVGVCYFEAFDHLEDTDDFDVTLNFSITPQKVYVF